MELITIKLTLPGKVYAIKYRSSNVYNLCLIAIKCSPWLLMPAKNLVFVKIETELTMNCLLFKYVSKTYFLPIKQIKRIFSVLLSALLCFLFLLTFLLIIIPHFCLSFLASIGCSCCIYLFSICNSSFCLSILFNVFPFVFIFFLSIFLSILPSFFLFFLLSILPCFCPSIFASTSPSLLLSVCLSYYLSCFASVYLSLLLSLLSYSCFPILASVFLFSVLSFPLSISFLFSLYLSIT